MARKVGDCWPKADAIRKQRQRLASSGPSGTEVLGCADIGTSAYPACTSIGLGRPVMCIFQSTYKIITSTAHRFTIHHPSVVMICQMAKVSVAAVEQTSIINTGYDRK